MSFLFSPSSRLTCAAVALLLLAVFLPPIAAAQAVYHVLEKGETLYSVAREYGVKPEAIEKANSIDDPFKLKAGRKLLIPIAAPAGKTHTISKGETLFSIAKAYGVGLEALRDANGLTPSSVIKAGDTLRVPAGGKAPSEAAAATHSAAVPESSTPASAIAPLTAAPSTQAPAPSPAPAMPEPVKTSAKAVSKGISWPCPGEIIYLDGKAYGVLIRAKLGEAVKAVASGTVSSAGPYRGYGNVVFILARTGHIYVYGGNGELSVRSGDQVRPGQELGKVGMDAKQGGPAAYFLVFKNGAAVDPASAPRD